MYIVYAFWSLYVFSEYVHPPIIILFVRLINVSLLLLHPHQYCNIMFHFRLHPFTRLQYNDKLKMAVKLFEGELTGPEGFAMDTQGNMYTGVSDGRIVRFNDTHYTTVATMGPPSFDKCGKFFDSIA